MSYNISDLKDRINAKVHNSINKLVDVDGLIIEAGNNLLLDVDAPSTIRVTQLSNGLYDAVYSYACPTDLKEDKMISLIPQNPLNQTPANNYNSTYSKEFDLRKEPGALSVEDNSTVRTLRASGIGLRAGVTLNDSNSLTTNGTWAATANATNLAVDTINFVSGNASLKFDLSTGGSTGYIENSTMQSVDLTDYVNTGSAFVYVYIPSITTITSISLRWGSDSSNYYSATATTTQDSTSFVVGWNLLRLDWNGAATTGTPTNIAINYARVTFAYNGTATPSCRVDNIVFRLPAIANLRYYSNYLYRSTAGTWLEQPTSTDDSDIINLDTTGFNMLVAECGYLASQELAGEDSSFDVDFFRKERDRVWGQYKTNNKSQALKRREPYYRAYVRRKR
jgi:hypothetical protein